MVAQFTAKMTVYFLSLMFFSVNKLKSHLLFACTNFMLSNFTWKKNFVPQNGVGGWGGITPPTHLLYVRPCIKVAEVVKQPASTITTTEQKRGGFTCCIPLCYNNSKVNKGLCFYVIPKEAVLIVAYDMQEKHSIFWPSCLLSAFWWWEKHIWKNVPTKGTL